MKRTTFFLATLLLWASAASAEPGLEHWTASLQPGTLTPQSMSSLAFGPHGILFIGDSKQGAVFAVDTGDRTPANREGRFSIGDFERKVAARLGTSPEEILIHDMATNPISRNIYLAASRARKQWDTRWNLPNDLADSQILLRLRPDDTLEEVALKSLPFRKVDLPNPVDEKKTHVWKEGASLRIDTVTDLVFHEGTLYVSGLSNEEFASTLWKMPFPSGDSMTWTTLEIYHGAHGAYETHAPIRTFLPYGTGDQTQILASYLCTPLVTFPLKGLSDGAHVKGRTVAEFGSGNYPLDMVLARFQEKEFIVMSNSMLPLMTFDPNDALQWKTPITKEVTTYSAGLPFVARTGAIQQMDTFNEEFMVALQRMPSGRLDLVSLSLERLAK